MQPNFICHPDFAELTPLDVFHKELATVDLQKHPEHLKNKHILFRKKINLKKISTATLKISADDYYKLYINGNFVTMGPAASYPNQYNYNEIDVKEFIHEGENAIAVHTYYQGLINRVWVSGDLRQMLWCELTIDGKVLMVSDADWKCAYHTAYTSIGTIGYDTAYAECYDSRTSEINFANADFDDSLWCNASIRKYSDYVLVKQKTPQLDIYRVPAQTVEETSYGYFVDFGQEMVGYLDISASGNESNEVLLYYGEELDNDGRVRYDMRCNCRYVEKWILSGGEDRLNNYDYKAFRYAEIHLSKNIKIKDIAMTVRHYPFIERAIYDTDNEKLNRIFNLCRNTIKYGTQENYVDCPTREKGQYLGDISIAARAHAILTDDVSLMKKALVDFCNSAFICPGLMTVSCSSLMQEIADYSLQFAASVLWAYKFDNDLEFLQKTEPYLTALYEYFIKFTDESGLICNQTEKNNLVDWPKNLRDGYDFPLTKPVGEGCHNVINAFWYGFLVSMNEIYKILGIPELDLHEKVKDSFYDSFYSKDIELFCDSTVSKHAAIHSNLLPLFFGMCEGNEKLINNIVQYIKEKKLTSMGTYMSYFALAALVTHDRTSDALELTCDDGAWLNMLKEGATTTFEAWGKDQKWNTSLFHPWSVAPLIVFNKKYEIY